MRLGRTEKNSSQDVRSVHAPPLRQLLLELIAAWQTAGCMCENICVFSGGIPARGRRENAWKLGEEISRHKNVWNREHAAAAAEVSIQCVFIGFLLFRFIIFFKIKATEARFWKIFNLCCFKKYILKLEGSKEIHCISMKSRSAGLCGFSLDIVMLICKEIYLGPLLY